MSPIVSMCVLCVFKIYVEIWFSVVATRTHQVVFQKGFSLRGAAIQWIRRCHAIKFQTDGRHVDTTELRFALENVFRQRVERCEKHCYRRWQRHQGQMLQRASRRLWDVEADVWEDQIARRCPGSLYDCTHECSRLVYSTIIFQSKNYFVAKTKLLNMNERSILNFDQTTIKMTSWFTSFDLRWYDWVIMFYIWCFVL